MPVAPAPVAPTPGRSRYSAVAILLHWLIAGFILANLVVGWRMGSLSGLAQFDAFQLHKSIGITVLVLSLARLGWRLTHRSPPLPAGMSGVERFAAHATHGIFYLMMIGMPLTGWALVSVSPLNIPTLLWHHIPWPHIAVLHDLPSGPKAGVDRAATNIHLALAFGGAALIALHVLAALKHQFLTRDGVLGRMIPFLSADPR
ncbi:cytochrome b [Sphingomonas sp. AP4-R1]|uniref:cytochrome b n=1 Tax=Sphingomonas sp. AP4-R1 TaxID=2735134 RepID=UPI001493A4E6|nr:cytochrome b [Sphingomonas sp. AP4-R1]QJU59167.1 cytochrome b [Sphingomonas sp. AP4-R1]